MARKWTSMQIIKTFLYWKKNREETHLGCWVPHKMSESDYQHKYKKVWILDQKTRDVKGLDYLHRIAWMAHNRKRIPKDYVVRHVCTNTWCFNPAHLVIGTSKDNEEDKNRPCRPEINTEHFPNL